MLMIKTDDAMCEHLKDLGEYLKDFMECLMIDIIIESGIDHYVQIKIRRGDKTATFITNRDELLAMSVNEIGDSIFDMYNTVWEFIVWKGFKHHGSENKL